LYADGTLQCAGLALTPQLDAIGRLYVHLDGDAAQANVTRDDIALSGAALLVRSSVFREVGGFDEAYRNGSEDVDLCLKIWTHGFRCRNVAAVSIETPEAPPRGKP